MRSGKISESILKRSVLKEIHTKNSDVISGAGIGNDAAVLKGERDKVVSTTTVTLGDGFWGRIGIYRVMNDIACMGGCMEELLINITMPQEFDEKVLKSILRQSEEVCSRYDIQIAGGHTEISDGVLRPLIVYTGIGSRLFDISGRIEPGQKIALTKWIGIEGAYLLSQYRNKELEARFPGQMLDIVKKGGDWLSVSDEAVIAAQNGVPYMHNLSNGGILNGLWELASRGNVGVKADFKKIPVRQEVIEVCELFDLNPYQLLSGGSLLMTIPPGYDIVGMLQEQGIPVSIIGETTDNHDKILMNEDEIRYLDVPGRDELWKIINS